MARVVIALTALVLCTGGALQERGENTVRTPDLTIVDKSLTYPLSGRTAAEIDAALRQHGILFTDGEDYRGAYVWRLEWSYAVASAGRTGCRVTRATVTLAAATTLPEWTAPADAPPALKTQWSEFDSALRAHEAGHREIAIRHAQTLRPKLLALRARDCETLRRDVQAAGDAVIEATHAEQVQFDARTQHGAATGAAWHGAVEPATAPASTQRASRPGRQRQAPPAPPRPEWLD